MSTESNNDVQADIVDTKQFDDFYRYYKEPEINHEVFKINQSLTVESESDFIN